MKDSLFKVTEVCEEKFSFCVVVTLGFLFTQRRGQQRPVRCQQGALSGGFPPKQPTVTRGSKRARVHPLRWQQRAKPGCWASDTDRFEDAHSRSQGFTGQTLRAFSGQMFISTRKLEQRSVTEGKQGRHAAPWREGNGLKLNQQPQRHTQSAAVSHNEREDIRGCGSLEGSSEDGAEAVHTLHMSEAFGWLEFTNSGLAVSLTVRLQEIAMNWTSAKCK